MRNFVLTAAVAAMFATVGASSSEASVVGFTELFPDGNPVPAGWTPFGGATVPNLLINTGAGQTDDDGTQNVAGSSLDGNLDGALDIDTQDASGVNMGVYIDAAGTMEEGEDYTLTARIFNPNVSFINVSMSLENATDTTVLADSGSNTLNGGNGNYRTLSLNYTGLASDAGDTLRLRFSGINVNSTARDFNIDNLGLTVTAIPEPGTLALAALGLCGLGVRRRR